MSLKNENVSNLILTGMDIMENETRECDGDLENQTVQDMSETSEASCDSDDDWTTSDASDFTHTTADNIVFMLCFLSLMYVFSSVVMMNSSFQNDNSNLNVLAVTNEIFVIDISSAALVLSGTVSAHLYNKHPDILFRVIVWLALDLWLSSALSLVVGSLYALTTSTFSVKSVALTLVEGLLCARCFDFSQNAAAPHNLNVVAWPASAIFFGLVSMPHTVAISMYIDRSFQKQANIVAFVLAIGSICVFSVFASSHSKSNVFYANSTSAMYRCLEFNLGVHVQHLLRTADVLTITIAKAAKRLAPVTVVIFLLIWWVEVGVPWMPYPLTCVRMYHFSPCIQDHHGFLVRGCILGLMMVCLLYTDVDSSASEVSSYRRLTFVARICLSAVCFCWPTCLVIDLSMQITFDRASVRHSAALLTPIYTACVLGASYLYHRHLQHFMFKPLFARAKVLQTRAHELSKCWQKPG